MSVDFTKTTILVQKILLNLLIRSLQSFVQYAHGKYAYISGVKFNSANSMFCTGNKNVHKLFYVLLYKDPVHVCVLDFDGMTGIRKSINEPNYSGLQIKCSKTLKTIH